MERNTPVLIIKVIKNHTPILTIEINRLQNGVINEWNFINKKQNNISQRAIHCFQ